MRISGGYFANSLAIMTDAAHLLSDFAGFMISLLALWVATKPATTTLSFGWHRAGNETRVTVSLVPRAFVGIYWSATGPLGADQKKDDSGNSLCRELS